MTEQTEPSRGVGDNLPPSRAEIMRANALALLQDENNDLLARRDELIEALDRVPVEIDDEDVEQRAIDFARQLREGEKTADARRRLAKEPYLATSKAVDGFFNVIIDRLKGARDTVEARLTSYQRKVAETARLKAEAEAAAAMAEAKELEAAATSDEELAEAGERFQAADDAADKAAKPAADRSRVRTTHGAVGSLRTAWTFEIEDAKAIPLLRLRSHFSDECLKKAIRSFIRAKGRELNGVRIFPSDKFVGRG